MRVVYNDWITEEMEAAFKAEETIYLSSDGEAWLFTDMEVFNEMNQKFQFDVDLDDREHVYNVDIENYIKNTYEENEFDYLGCRIQLADYYECVLDCIEYNGLDGNDWDKTIDDWIKADVMTEVREQVTESLSKMVDVGWDLTELIGLTDSVLHQKGLK